MSCKHDLRESGYEGLEAGAMEQSETPAPMGYFYFLGLYRISLYLDLGRQGKYSATRNRAYWDLYKGITQ